MKTLYVSDLDGTLLTSAEKVSAYSLERLNRLLNGGISFTIASARSVSSARKATEGLNLRMPAILYNGGLIYDYTTGEALHHVLLQEDWKYYILSVLREYNVVSIVFGAKDGRERLCWDSQKETEGIRRYLWRRRGDERLVPARSEGELLDGHVFYIKCIGPREQLESAWNILKYDSRFICIFHQETYQNDFWMEISPREATKASGVKFLRNHFGYEKVVCFGDTSNDSDMFDVCEEKYAVMNADHWLKEKATDVIGYCEEDGVVKWLEEHFHS